MTLKKTATPGLSILLSGLLLSGNLLFPFAAAAQAGEPVQSLVTKTPQKTTTFNPQLHAMVKSQLNSTAAQMVTEQGVHHPITASKKAKAEQPLTFNQALSMLFPNNKPVAQVAKTVPVQAPSKLAAPVVKPTYIKPAAPALAVAATLATPKVTVAATATTTTNALTTATTLAKATPITAQATPTKAPGKRFTRVAKAKKPLAAPIKPAETTTKATPISDAAPGPIASIDEKAPENQKTYSFLDNHPEKATEKPATSQSKASMEAAPAAQPQKAEPARRLLASGQTTAKTKAKALKGIRSVPRWDSTAPDVRLNGNGNLTVLKSGISQKVTSIDLAIGKAELLHLSRPATRVSVSNPDVASAVVISPTQIQLVGQNVGVANLLIWGSMNSAEHSVVDISVHRDVSVLVNQLKYVDPGIQIVPMAAEDTIILTGQAESRESAQLAIEMAKAYFSKGSSGLSAPSASGGTTSSSGGPSSTAPGSALPGVATNVINLIKVKGEPSTKIELVRQRLQEIDPNIRIEVVPGPQGNEKVILTGRVPTASIASKALNLASVFYGQPGMKLITAQGGNEFARMQVSGTGNEQTTTTTAGGANGAGTGGVNVLQGSVMTDASGNVISMLEVAQKPQIKCSIKFLELNKTALNALGGTLSGTSGNSMLASWSGVQSAVPGRAISSLSSQDMSGSAWQTMKNGSGVSQLTQGRFNEVFQNGVTQVFSLNNQITGAIQALAEKKQARTLAEPTLTLLSGEQGSFLAGGEIPIAFVGGQGQVSIQYKEFGIRLNLLPSVTDDGKVQMQLSPEVSALDQTKGVSTNSISVPAFVTRRLNTTLLVEPGQSLALAGLYSQEDTDSASRFPGIGSLPILGSFFRNSWKDHRNTEMVVIIKPEIIYSTTGATRQALESPAPSVMPAHTPTEVSKN